MTLSEFENRLSRIESRLETEVEAQAARAGADLVALVTNRVVQTGRDSQGGSFTPYSTKGIPAFFFFGKSRNSAGENAVRAKAKNRQPISYKEFRALNNLNTSPKNFEFTGAMWRGFGVIAITRTPSGVAVTIGGRNEDSAEKIQWGSEHEGKSIIKPSAEEIATVRANLQNWLKAVVNG